MLRIPCSCGQQGGNLHLPNEAQRCLYTGGNLMLIQDPAISPSSSSVPHYLLTYITEVLQYFCQHKYACAMVSSLFYAPSVEIMSAVLFTDTRVAESQDGVDDVSAMVAVATSLVQWTGGTNGIRSILSYLPNLISPKAPDEFGFKL